MSLENPLDAYMEALSWKALVPGVVSSFIALLLVGTYGLGQRKYARHALKQILPSADNRCAFVCPAIGSSERSLMSHNDAVALGYLVGMADKINVEFQIVSCMIGSSDAPSAVVTIGGQGRNLDSVGDLDGASLSRGWRSSQAQLSSDHGDSP
jgi:hypothetical protein